MQWVVAYDIRDNGRRRRVVRVLRGYGRRVQYSVFECSLDRRGYERLRQKLSEAIEPRDSVLFYHLCGDCRGRCSALPEDRQPGEEPPVLVV
jgi:CRISPR-associated protein Cas2